MTVSSKANGQMQALDFPPLRLLHSGYVTRDMERGIECLIQMFGESTSIKRNHDVQITTSSGTALIDYAAVKIGGQSFESIQPGKGAESIYAMSLPDHADVIGFHHLGSRVDGLEEWDALITSVTQKDIPLLVHGRTGTVDYAYVDLRHIIGHVIEYLHYG